MDLIHNGGGGFGPSPLFTFFFTFNVKIMSKIWKRNGYFGHQNGLFLKLHILLDPVKDFWKCPKKGFKKYVLAFFYQEKKLNLNILNMAWWSIMFL